MKIQKLKRITKVLGILLLLYIGISFWYSERIRIESPSGNKSITIFHPFYLWNSKYYIIPTNYEDWTAPKNNYAIIEIRGGFDAMNYLYVNWSPGNDFQMKLFYNYRVIENKMDTLDYLFSKNYEGFLDDGEFFKYPEYYSYDLLEEIDK